jgi:hypothetical protein
MQLNRNSCEFRYLRSLLAECRQVQPEAVLSIEEPQELFNHLIGIQDYWCDVASELNQVAAKLRTLSNEAENADCEHQPA